jgi:K+-transporting ATPase ATPase C chain
MMEPSDSIHDSKRIQMSREVLSALRACLITFMLCSVAYPLIVWGGAQLVFPHQAQGSLVYSHDRTLIGSELIAQPFASDRYFRPRPSAVDYNAAASGGSNLAPTNPDLRQKLQDRALALGANEKQPVPGDLVMASGGGLDPDISPEAAYYQADKVAAARGIRPAQVRKLIESHIDNTAAFIGAPPRVNVLRLNLSLDEQFPRH